MDNQVRIGRIVVAHDFSETAEYAFQYGLGVAEKFSALVTVAHVCDVDAYASPDAFVASFDWASEVEQVAAESLDRLIAHARRPGVDIRTTLRRGQAWRGIVETALEFEADLIVMGTHGRRGLSHALLGSVAERVVRVAPCPVLTVHLPRVTAKRAEERAAAPKTAG
jgi:nucleotide-binding universal stress UspA family protein